jgi:hypothetical protein
MIQIPRDKVAPQRHNPSIEKSTPRISSLNVYYTTTASDGVDVVQKEYKIGANAAIIVVGAAAESPAGRSGKPGLSTIAGRHDVEDDDVKA